MIAGFAHERDGTRLRVTGCGPTLADALAQAALGVFTLLNRGASPASGSTREVRAHGRSLDDLLARWIAECLYVYEIEGFVANRIEFAALSAVAGSGGETVRLHSILHGGEAHDPPMVLEVDAEAAASVTTWPDGFEANIALREVANSGDPPVR
jgi:SHS2 domain-containing protein